MIPTPRLITEFDRSSSEQIWGYGPFSIRDVRMGIGWCRCIYSQSLKRFIRTYNSRICHPHYFLTMEEYKEGVIIDIDFLNKYNFTADKHA
jgi:hypothetical protein